MLHLTAQKGHGKIVQLLLMKDVNVDVKDETEFTALDLAALNGHQRIIQFLLQMGANIGARTNDGWTGQCTQSAG